MVCPSWPRNAWLNQVAYRSTNQNSFTNVQTKDIVLGLNRRLTNQSHPKFVKPKKISFNNFKAMKVEHTKQKATWTHPSCRRKLICILAWHKFSCHNNSLRMSDKLISIDNRHYTDSVTRIKIGVCGVRSQKKRLKWKLIRLLRSDTSTEVSSRRRQIFR